MYKKFLDLKKELRQDKQENLFNWFSLLLFNVELYNKEYKKEFNKFVNGFFNELIHIHSICLTSNDIAINKIFIDNKEFEFNKLYYLSWNDLINNYYVKNSNFTFYSTNKLFLIIDRHNDITYYRFFVDKNGKKSLENIISFNSWKYKFNFTKQERTLVYKLKNNYLRGFKYSWNYLYFIELQDRIKTLELREFELKELLKTLNLELQDIKKEINKILNKGFNTNSLELKLLLKEEYLQELNNKELVLNDIREIREELKELELKELELKKQESNLLSSKLDYNTTLKDYELENSYLE